MNTPKRYTPYYRVSTRGQGESGLGLGAQKSDVLRYVNNDASHLVGEFVEIETGKQNSRVELQRAIAFCKANNTTLLVAKLDRLSRNAGFIFKLRDEQVKFECCDIPEANTLTIGIFATIAQHERELISKRTKDALAELKKKGVKLGSPQNFTNEGRRKGAAATKQKALENENNRRAAAYIKNLRESGRTYQQITDELNAAGFRTSRGNSFKMLAVQRLHKRVEIDKLHA